MEILKFEIVDLGAAPVDTVFPGDTFRQNLDSSILGTGSCAADSVKNALDQLALDGYGTKLLHESFIEGGWYGQSASEPASNLYEGEDDDSSEEVIEYHVLIHFEDPIVDAEEVK